MTVEQMNRDIAEYMGYEPYKLGSKIWFSMGDMGKPFDSQLKYHTSFDWLMPVWQKLRGELLESMSEFNVTMLRRIQYPIIACDLPTAHRLIHEAITMIKNK